MYIVDTQFGRCFKVQVGDIEISVACESIRGNGVFTKCDIRIYKDGDITEKIMGHDIIHADDEDFIDVVKKVVEYDAEQTKREFIEFWGNDIGGECISV